MMCAANSDAQFPPSEEFTNHALVLAALPSLAVPYFLSPLIIAATTAAKTRLTIVLFSRLFDVHGDQAPFSHTTHWHSVQQLLTYVYVQASTVAQDMDNILLDITVLLKGMNDELSQDIIDGVERVYRVRGDCIAACLPMSLMDMPHYYLPAATSPVPSPPDDSDEASYGKDGDLPSLFPVVIIGGTFDHLHAGHKILLSMAAWIAAEKIIVGVTDSALLTSKAHAQYLESLETRISRVTNFLKLFKPTLKQYEVVSISDVYGPTAWDDNIQALVVSEETRSGAEAVSKYRAEHGLSPLKTFVIDVISPTEVAISKEDADAMKRLKISSTFIRQWIASRKES